MSDQETILKNMSPLPWELFPPEHKYETGAINDGNGNTVLENAPSGYSCHTQGMQNASDIEACYTAVSATYGSGILPSEVKEMMELLESIAGWTGGDGVKAKCLLTRINNRRK